MSRVGPEGWLMVCMQEACAVPSFAPNPGFALPKVADGFLVPCVFCPEVVLTVYA